MALDLVDVPSEAGRFTLGSEEGGRRVLQGGDGMFLGRAGETVGGSGSEGMARRNRSGRFQIKIRRGQIRA